MRPLAISGSWVVLGSVAVLTMSAGELLLEGPRDFGWFRIALLSLIAGALLKLYLEGRKQQPEETERPE